MVSPSCSSRSSSSSFVEQYIVLSSEKEIPASSCVDAARGRSSSGEHVAPRKAIVMNIRGVIPFSRSSTQAALLTRGARGENRANEFFTPAFIFKAPGLFVRCCAMLFPVSPRTLVHPEVLRPSARIPSLSVLR